jgi:tRNA(Ile)-lysidine synthase
VAHLHHGIRGDEADKDALFVRALSADWDLPCSTERVDIPALARRHRIAIEEAARQARYSFLGRVARSAGSRCIAVGHNADDQAETVLMHWIRGAGLAGLRGMLPVTPLADYRLIEAADGGHPAPDVFLVRPLLGVSRSQIEAYCTHHVLEPRFDRSNLDTTYHRNWLRHEVLPLLASHNPNIHEVFRRSASVLADDYELLRSILLEVWARVVHEETPERITFDLVGWRDLPVSLQRSTVREAVQRLRRSVRNLGFVHVENAVEVARRGSAGAQATLPRGLALTVGYDRLVLGSAGAAPALPDWPLLTADCGVEAVGVPGSTSLPGSTWRLEIRVVARSALPSGWESNSEPWRAFVDGSVVRGRLWLRARQPGDRFQPLGMGGQSVKLSDYFTNQKVPRAVRDRLPLLVTDTGIAWVCGYRIDERARIRASTEEALILRFVQ